MKSHILILTLLGTLVRAYAQGVIDFANGLPHLFPPPDRLVRYAAGVQNPFGTNNAPLVGTNYHAQLYIGLQTADESSLIPVMESLTTFRPVTTAQPGAWLGSYLDFPQYNPGDLVKLQVRVWDSTFGGSYEEAGGNGIHGKSLVFFYSFEFPTTEPNYGTMRNFQGFTVSYVPEPSVIAIFIGGAVFGTSLRSSKLSIHRRITFYRCKENRQHIQS